MFVCLVRFEKIFVAKFLVAQFAIGFMIKDSQTADATATTLILQVVGGRRWEFIIGTRR